MRDLKPEIVNNGIIVNSVIIKGENVVRRSIKLITE